MYVSSRINGCLINLRDNCHSYQVLIVHSFEIPKQETTKEIKTKSDVKKYFIFPCNIQPRINYICCKGNLLKLPLVRTWNQVVS